MPHVQGLRKLNNLPEESEAKDSLRDDTAAEPVTDAGTDVAGDAVENMADTNEVSVVCESTEPTEVVMEGVPDAEDTVSQAPQEKNTRKRKLEGEDSNDVQEK